MLSKTIAAHALPIRLRAQKHPKTSTPSTQAGVTLIELLIGLVIGLLVIGVATGALMVSRGISGTVSDASTLQQQAAYAMRVIGTQIRQAGSLRLNMSYNEGTALEPYKAEVAIETYAPAVGGNAFDPGADTFKSATNSVTIGYRRYTEPVYVASADQSQVRNCVGGPADTSTDQGMENIFTFDAASNELRCAGNGIAAQAIVQNVANFQVRYLLQDNSAGADQSKMKFVSTVGSSARQIRAIEVCIVLFGNESIELTSGSNYTDCDGTTKDMSTQTGKRAKRMHMVFRNVFQTRSQGLSS